MKLAIILVSFASVLAAQPTTVPLPALRGGSVVGLVACIIPAGALAENGCLYRIVTLGQGIGIDTTTTPPTLRVVPAPPPPVAAPVVEKTVVIRPTAGKLLMLPDVNWTALKLFVNGLRYNTPEDYTTSPQSAAVTFRVAFEPGDVVVAEYKIQ
jgi:hypothetical protein